MTAEDRAVRSGRCPDGGYCHGSTLADREPCPEGTCYRVRFASPLSGAFPGNRWPDHVLRANGIDPDEPTREEVERAERYVEQGLADDLGDPTKPSGYTLAALRAYRDGLTQGRERALQPFRDLFSGGPDTSCRTRWRDESSLSDPFPDRTECVEVPLDDVRQAFTEAGDEP